MNKIVLNELNPLVPSWVAIPEKKRQALENDQGHRVPEKPRVNDAQQISVKVRREELMLQNGYQYFRVLHRLNKPGLDEPMSKTGVPLCNQCYATDKYVRIIEGITNT